MTEGLSGLRVRRKISSILGTPRVTLDLEATPNAVFLIEWGLPYAKNFTENWLEVRISRSDFAADASDAASGLRTVEIIAVGERWANLDLSRLEL